MIIIQLHWIQSAEGDYHVRYNICINNYTTDYCYYQTIASAKGHSSLRGPNAPRKMLQGSEINYCQGLESAGLMVAKLQRLYRTITVKNILHMKLNIGLNVLSLNTDIKANSQRNHAGNTITLREIETKLRQNRTSSTILKSG